MKYFECNPNGTLVPTNERPDSKWMRTLKMELMDIRRKGKIHRHRSGDGHHYIPTEPRAVRSPYGGWYIRLTDCTGPVLAFVKGICDLLHLDYAELYQQAYPDRPFYNPTSRDLHWCYDTPRIERVYWILWDLKAIGYPNLADALEDAVFKATGEHNYF